MCGRYTQTCDLRALKDRFGLCACRVEVGPRRNIAPTQEAPVVLLDGGRVLDSLRWGLVPSWARDASIGARLINARAETLSEKPAFKTAFRKSRCLVVADGFYEWRHDGKAKVPMRFTLPSGEPFAMAGLWDSWKAPDGRSLRSFTIVTTQANGSVRPVHPRMPVILRPDDEEAWLDPGRDAAGLLRPYPGGLDAREVPPPSGA